MAVTRPAGRSVSRRSTPTFPPTSSSINPASGQRQPRDLQNELANNSKGDALKSNTDRKGRDQRPKRNAGPAISSRLSPLVEASGSQPGISDALSSVRGVFHDPSTLNTPTVAEALYAQPDRHEIQSESTENGQAIQYETSVVASAARSRGSRRSIGEQAARLAELKAQRAQEARTALQDDSSHAETVEHFSPSPAADLEPPVASGLEELLQHDNVRTGPVLAVCKTVESHIRQSNKENIDTPRKGRTFVDRQEGAKRVAWDGDSQNVDLGQYDQDQVMTTGEENDDDFEATIPSNASKRRKLLQSKTDGSAFPRQPSSKRATARGAEENSRRGDSDSDQELEGSSAASGRILPQQRAVAAFQRPPQSAQAPMMSSFPAQPRLDNTQNTIAIVSPTTLPVSTGEHLDEVRRMARQRAAQAKPRSVQVRSPYTHAEEERLLDLIELYGISYSLIKEMDGVHEDGALLEGRSQVQIKDKAQDLKFQFLKAGTGLPTNFDKIPLRSRMRDQLERLGIFES